MSDGSAPDFRVLTHKSANASSGIVNGCAQVSHWSCWSASSVGADSLGQVNTVSCMQQEHSEKNIENFPEQLSHVQWCNVFSARTSKPSVSECPQAGQMIASISKPSRNAFIIPS